MSDTTIQFRTDSILKSEAEALCEQLGIPMSVNLNMYLRQFVRQKGIPFAVALEEKAESDLSDQRCALLQQIRKYRGVFQTPDEIFDSIKEGRK